MSKKLEKKAALFAAAATNAQEAGDTVAAMELALYAAQLLTLSRLLE